MKSYTNKEINDLAESALDVACAFIQEQMNIETGDVAGIFFSGDNQKIVESIMRNYIKTEIQFKDLPTE